MGLKNHRARQTAWVLATVLTCGVVLSGCGSALESNTGQILTLSVNQDGAGVAIAPGGVVCLTYTLSGPANAVFDLHGEYTLSPSTTHVNMTTLLSPAVLLAAGLASAPTTVTLDATGHATGNFYWFAGGDLGFAGGTGTAFVIPTQQGGSSAGQGALVTFNYQSGSSSFGVAGAGSSAAAGAAPPGATGGRARHTADAQAGAPDVVIAGGHTHNGASSTLTDAYDTVNKFALDLNTFMVPSVPSSHTMGSRRTDLASSFFFDPNTGATKLLITGGAAGDASNAASVASADIYAFTPETLMPTLGALAVSRRGHTATWIPDNRVVVIGGESVVSNMHTGLASIEIYSPITQQFSTSAVVLAHARRGHTATLLPNGTILIAGGFNPAAPTVALAAEIVDVVNVLCVPVPGSVDRVGHSATRLANGHVLLAGGRAVSNNVISNNAAIFWPEFGPAGGFTATAPLMNSPRAFHAASLLGDLSVLLSGGETSPTGAFLETGSVELFMPASQVFSPLAHAMTTARADHSSTALSSGTVVIVGGRQTPQPGATANFLDSIEVFPLTNALPNVATAATATANLTGKLLINATVTDVDGDGGYVIIRYRTLPGGTFRRASIDQQTPSTAAGNFPNFQVSPGLYSFRWDTAMDMVPTGTAVEIEVLPVGTTLGTPVRFNAQVP